MQTRIYGMALLLFCLNTLLGQTKKAVSVKKDWLIGSVNNTATIFSNEKYIVISNGLLQRKFLKGENLACIDFTNLSNGQQLIRSIEPEAKIKIDSTLFSIGGMSGQTEKAYLIPQNEIKYKRNPNDFIFKKYSSGPLVSFIQSNTKFWKPEKTASSIDTGGLHVQFEYESTNPNYEGITVWVHYNVYNNIPLMTKWVTIQNNSTHSIVINKVVNEVLGLVEEESAVVGKPEIMKKQHGIYVETNYAFNNAMRYDISDQTTHWKTDSNYTSQVNYNYETPCLLEIYPENVSGIELSPTQSFTSVRTNELLMDSYDRERRGLMIRKMYRTIAPWVTQNPIFMHLVSKNDEEVINAIDQCAMTGYEAVILSFGSHLNMEDTSQKNLDRWTRLANYAHQKNIFIGGYSLFSSRKISETDDVIDPKTGKTGGAFFGNAPCFGSKWGLTYRDKIKYFYSKTKFDIWENDGPYPGDVCASINHPGHKGLDDSQWRQMEIQKELYKWLNESGVYINAPDWYFLDGTHKIALGYREVNFSLSRAQQLLLNRQNIHDGTIEKTPSMGWGFVPLTKYQGGGPEAILEPLSEHLSVYKQLMMQYYGAGVQACYRGPRLYDTDTTKQMVQSVIAWYKKYRNILNADIIHLRRADGRDWDGWLHVNPNLPQKGLMLFFNPTNETITKVISLPVYYTGANHSIIISESDTNKKSFLVNRDYSVDFEFSIPPNSYKWYTLY